MALRRGRPVVDNFIPQAATYDTGSGVPRTSTESRPVNAYVNYIIKI